MPRTFRMVGLWHDLKIDLSHIPVKGSHQLVPWIDLFSLNVLFLDQAMPEFIFYLFKNYAHIYTWMHANVRASSQRKGLEWGWKRRVRLEGDTRPSAQVLCAKISISPALRTLQNRFWEKNDCFPVEEVYWQNTVIWMKSYPKLVSLEWNNGMRKGLWTNQSRLLTEYSPGMSIKYT